MPDELPDDDEGAPCPECGCAPGERRQEREGDGTWSTYRDCGCACHDED